MWNKSLLVEDEELEFKYNFDEVVFDGWSRGLKNNWRESMEIKKILMIITDLKIQNVNGIKWLRGFSTGTWPLRSKIYKMKRIY